MSALIQVIALISTLVTIYLTNQLLRLFYTSYLAYHLGYSVQWKPSSTTWAVITGATSGIGLEYANKLAEIGYSLLLLSRDKEKLEKTRSELLEKYENCCNINVLAVDFTQTDIYDIIQTELNKLENIDVLVNNVGMFGPQDYFLKTLHSEDMAQNLIYCNTLSTTQMIGLCLPRMVDNRRGIIINISSFLASVPVPLFSIYSATKVYVDFLSRALELEYRDKGIVIQSVLPGIVGNKLFNPLAPLEDLNISMDRVSNIPVIKYLKNLTPNEFVCEAIKTVGIEKRTYGHLRHKIIYNTYDIWTQFFGSELMSTTYYHFFKIKKIFG